MRSWRRSTRQNTNSDTIRDHPSQATPPTQQAPSSQQAHPKRRLAGNERGTTATEVIVTLAIMAAVSIPTMRALQSATRTDSRLSHSIDAQQDMHIASTQLTADIRNGTLSPALRSGTQLQHSLPLIITQPNGTEVLIEWTLTNNGLIRHVGAPVIGSIRKSTIISENIVLVEDRSSFIYLTDDGVPIDPNSETSNLEACTAQIQIILFTHRLFQGNSDAYDSWPTSSTFRLNKTAHAC